MWKVSGALREVVSAPPGSLTGGVHEAGVPNPFSKTAAISNTKAQSPVVEGVLRWGGKGRARGRGGWPRTEATVGKAIPADTAAPWEQQRWCWMDECWLQGVWGVVMGPEMTLPRPRKGHLT